MKLVTYLQNETEAVGFIGSDAEKLVPAASLGYLAAEMIDLIAELGGKASDELRAKVEQAEGIPLASVRLLAPIRRPRHDITCLGVNYYEHRQETIDSDISYDEKAEIAPIYFGKRVALAVDPDGEIESHTGLVERLDYEVELAVIIGRDARGVTAEEAKDYIFGYTILNDVSARDLQSKHQQWYLGKCLDGFTPIGPWIVTPDELPPNAYIRSYVNGELRQNNTIDHMMTPPEKAIEQLTRGMTLQAGSIIASGTPSGVGMAFDPPKWMHPGDVVRCEIEGIGALTNTVR